MPIHELTVSLCPHLLLLNATTSLSVCKHGLAIQSVQPHPAPWAERLADTNSRTVGFVPRGAVAVEC